MIETIEPRRTLFYRSDARRQKLIAANVTQVVVVVAPQPPYSDDLVNRCLVGAEHAGIAALDRAQQVRSAGSATRGLRRASSSTAASATASCTLRAKRDLSPLEAQLRGQVTVLVGQSGMGKSTIINGLVPARGGARRRDLDRARHRPPHDHARRALPPRRRLAHHRLARACRNSASHHLTPQDAAHAFVEFRPWLGACRFRDCLHVSEPDCAITDGGGRRQDQRAAARFVPAPRRGAHAQADWYSDWYSVSLVTHWSLDLDPVFLSRIQFAFLIAFHFLLPAFTIGLASYIAVLEGLYLKTRRETYLRISAFWIRIFAVSFGMGVVSGIVMPFQFGTNWSRYSEATAAVIAPLMGYEALTAFFLEAAFLGVLLFGRKLVPQWVHFASAVIVAVGHALLRVLDPRRQQLDADAGRLRDRRRPVHPDELDRSHLQPVVPVPARAHRRRGLSDDRLHRDRRRRVVSAAAAATRKSRAS